MKRTPLPPRSTPLKRSPVRKKRKTARRVSVLRNRKYLDRLRSLACVVCATAISADDWIKLATTHTGVGWPVDPAHGRVNGRGSKGPDSEAIPLCRFHHEEMEKLRWPGFEKKYGFSREKEAAAHWAAFCLVTGREPVQ